MSLSGRAGCRRSRCPFSLPVRRCLRPNYAGRGYRHTTCVPPKSDGLVSVLSTCVFLAKQGHEIILRDGHSASGVCFNLAVENRAAFHDEERVTKGTVAPPVLYLTFQVHPVVLVEPSHLRTHVGQVKGLPVGIFGEQPVGRGAKVPPVVAASPVVFQFRALSGRNIRVAWKGSPSIRCRSILCLSSCCGSRKCPPLYW